MKNFIRITLCSLLLGGIAKTTMVMASSLKQKQAEQRIARLRGHLGEDEFLKFIKEEPLLSKENPDKDARTADSSASSIDESPLALLPNDANIPKQRAGSSSPVAIRHSRQASQAASEKLTTRYAELADGEELTTIDLNDNKTSQRIQPIEIERDAPAATPGCFSAFKRACLNAWRRLTGGNK